VVAIIGVETQYGGNMGKFRVLEALATLAFDYPRRAAYFRKELENFLLLARPRASIRCPARFLRRGNGLWAIHAEQLP
jgi:membrane-bound lytic murein transglycosylase B